MFLEAQVEDLGFVNMFFPDVCRKWFLRLNKKE